MAATSKISFGLAIKFPLTLTAFIAGVGLAIGLVLTVQDWYRFRDVLEREALFLANSVAKAAPEHVVRKDYWALHKMLRAAGSGSDGHANVLTAMVLDTSGMVMAHLQPNQNPVGLRLAVPKFGNEKNWLDRALAVNQPTIINAQAGEHGFVEAVVPVYADEKRLALVRVRLSTQQFTDRAWEAGYAVLTTTLILVVLGSLLGTVISRRMTHPLTELTDGMDRLSRGDYVNLAPVRIVDRDEIGNLAATFNRMAAELAEKRKLEQQMAMSERFIALGRISAGVAHEVNNPLAGMLNCIDTLKSRPDDIELTKRYLPLLESGMRRISDIVSALLGGMRYEGANEVVPATCLNESRDLIGAELNGSNVVLEWDNKLGENELIHGQRTQQIILNLLRNAIQVMPDAGTVQFRAHRRDDEIVLEVEDNGPGISQEDLPRLFEPFFTHRQGGTGLGLWVVYQLIQSMDGSVEVHSEPGDGTLFRVILPTAGPIEIASMKDRSQ